MSVNLFSKDQLQLILLACQPTKLNQYLTGIMTIDTFIITLISSGIVAIVFVITAQLKKLFNSYTCNEKKILTLQIEYYATIPYNEHHKSIFYESLSWLISQQIKSFEYGSFILKVTTNKNRELKNIFNNSNILPENNHKISIEYNGNKFNVQYKLPESKVNMIQNGELRNYTMIMQQKHPSIYLSTVECTNTIDKIYELLNQITNFYLENQKIKNGLFKYENIHSSWTRVQKLSSCRGLDSISLDEEQEIILKKELETFVNDKTFFEKIGIPYKRGILLFGKPGTGKTSLINAMSVHLSRDAYHLNLKVINNDNELYSLFSSVPSNQLIIIEDVDAQTNVLHRRKLNLNIIEPHERKNSFTLSSFLSCLDGHIISEGNIIIMTTNHIELIDPACIRAGRMDIHLELGYCTRYQLNKLFKTVIDKTGLSEHILNSIPEKLLPPCEVMTLFMLYNNNIDNNKENIVIIIKKLNELVIKYTKNQNEDKISNKKRKLQ